MKGKYLINTDNWFIAPDGKQYKAVWGEIEIVEDIFLGLKTNRNSTNWFAKIGSDEKHVIVAGCQIHYATKCNNIPNINDAEEWFGDATNGVKLVTTPTKIYIAENLIKKKVLIQHWINDLELDFSVRIINALKAMAEGYRDLNRYVKYDYDIKFIEDVTMRDFKLFHNLGSKSWTEFKDMREKINKLQVTSY